MTKLQIKTTGSSYKAAARLSAVFLLALASLLTYSAHTAYAACASPASDYGQDKLTVTVPAAGTYRIWSHIYAPSASANSYLLEVDGNTCYSVGGGSAITPAAWTWVDYQSGSTSSVVQQANLTAGNHTLTLIGNTSGLQLDDILLTTDTTCTPTGDGSNCQIPTTLPAPTVTINASPTSVASGAASTLTWLSTNADSCTASGAWGGSEAISGTYQTSALTNTSAYTLTCTGAGGSGSASTTVTVTPATTTTTLTPPTSLTATLSGTSQTNLVWQDSGAGIVSYNIYRATVGTGTSSYSKVATVSDTSYGDTNLNPSTTYSYYVTAVDGSGTESSKSGVVQVKTPAAVTSTNPQPTTTGNVEGVVQNDRNQPIVGATVSITVNRKSQTYTTNSSGQYAISGLSQGQYTIAFSAPDYVTSSTNVTIKSGSTSTKNVTLDQSHSSSSGRFWHHFDFRDWFHRSGGRR